MNFNRKWGAVFFSAVLALLVALANRANALADDDQCMGSLGAISVDNLRVPENGSCTLNGTSVNGNISVEANAILDAYDVQVDGNIQADNAAHLNVYAGSFVKGNIQIHHSGAAEIQSVDIDGNLSLDDNDLFLNMADNTISGSLQANKNTGGLSITGNTIGGNLQCKENFPPPTGEGNIVKGDTKDQCADMDGDTSPVPTDSPPAPTSTPPAPTPTPLVPTQTPPAITDQEAPTVQWTAPVLAGERYDIREGEEVVLLEVEASDNGSLRQVTFLRWDAVNEQYINLGNLVQPPFRITISASTLNPGWNQVFVTATDLAGNSSDRSYIWLYKLDQGQVGSRFYLPFLRK